MTACVLFVVSYLFGDVTAGVTTGFVGLMFLVLWFGLGWWRRRDRSRRTNDDASDR